MFPFQKSAISIYAVKTIDQGIEILTGVKAGSRLDDGSFEQDSINFRINKNLRVMAEKLKEFPEFVIERRDN